MSGDKVKVKEVGDKCRHCDDTVILKETKKSVRSKTQSFGYTHYLYCNSCKSMYHQERYKFNIDGTEVKEKLPTNREILDLHEQRIKALEEVLDIAIKSIKELEKTTAWFYQIIRDKGLDE